MQFKLFLYTLLVLYRVEALRFVTETEDLQPPESGQDISLEQIIQGRKPFKTVVYTQALKEEGLHSTYGAQRGVPPTPYLLMWPRSWWNTADKMKEESKKTRKFNFVGEVGSTTHSRGAGYEKLHNEHRAWVEPFAKNHFTSNDFYVDTAKSGASLGEFDHSIGWKGQNMQKIMHSPRRKVFDPVYMEQMAKSEFTLCPGGDKPFSYRFIEAIAVKSIPIVEDDSVANAEMRMYGDDLVFTPKIGFHYYIKNDDPNFQYVYNEEWAEENLKLAKQHHSFMKEFGESVDNRAVKK
jgi:hypothetical protein